MTEYLNCYVDMWKNFKDFSGRSTRLEYWVAVLINAVVAGLVSAVGTQIGVDLASLYSLLVLIPSLALLVRRLNDIGKTWPWIFIGCIPLIGWIWMIILLCRKSI